MNHRLLALLLAVPTLAPAQRGDVDGDGEITVLDVQRTVHDILGRGPGHHDRGDFDRDGDVDVFDVQRAVNAVLGRTPALLDAQPRAVASGDPLVLFGMHLDDVEVRFGDRPARILERGPDWLEVQVPEVEDFGLHPVVVRRGETATPPLRVALPCPEGCPPAPLTIRAPQVLSEGAPILIDGPGGDVGDPFHVAAWLDTEAGRFELGLAPAAADGANAQHGRFRVDLRGAPSGQGTLRVEAVDPGGVLWVEEAFQVEVVPPHIAPPRGERPGEVEILTEGDVDLGVLQLDGDVRLQGHVGPQGASVRGLPAGDYLFVARSEWGVASEWRRVEPDTPAHVLLDAFDAPAPIVAFTPLALFPGGHVDVALVDPFGLRVAPVPFELWIDGEPVAAAEGHLPRFLLPEGAERLELHREGAAPHAFDLRPHPTRFAGYPDVPPLPESPAQRYAPFDCTPGGMNEMFERLLVERPGAMAWFEALAARVIEADDAECVVWLGLAPFGAVGRVDALLDGELAVTDVCTTDAHCGGCSPLSEALEAPRNQAGSFEGICGVLSVAHSLYHKLGVVDAGDAVNGRKWKKSFLDRIRRESGHDSDGTTVSGEQDAYEDFDDGEDYDISCESAAVPDDWDLDSGAVQRDEMKAWCEALDKSSDTDDEDCTFVIHGRDLRPDGKKVGHAMHIKSVRWDEANGDCYIEVVNTGRQGSGSGDDVDVNPGDQTWKVSHSGTAASNVTIQRGSSGYRFWRDNFSFTSVKYYCCEVER